MSNIQRKALKLVKKFIPKDFGIKEAYYRIDGKVLEFVFIVDKRNASGLISYLNSLVFIIDKELKNIDMGSSVYIYKRDNKIQNLVREEKLQKINLNLAGVMA